MKTRTILAHAHIFKNAGTTIDWILDRNFGLNFLDDRNDFDMVSDLSYLPKLLSSKHDLVAISSHSLPLPINKIDGFNIYVMILLRHPLTRIRSVYDFERKQKANTPGAIHAKKYTFKEYVSWRMMASVNPTIRNMYTRYLTRNSLKPVEDMSEQHLILAKDFIADTQLVGIVEDFDRSMIVFENVLQSYGFDVDFSYKKQNVSSSKTTKEDNKLEKLQYDLGAVLFQEVVDKNAHDMKLYDYSVQHLSSRFETITDSAEQLKHLRIRSKNISI